MFLFLDKEMEAQGDETPCSGSRGLQSGLALRLGLLSLQPFTIGWPENVSLHEHLLCAEPCAEALGVRGAVRSLRPGVHLALGEPHWSVRAREKEGATPCQQSWGETKVGETLTQMSPHDCLSGDWCPSPKV